MLPTSPVRVACCASQYLLPAWALGSLSLREFDDILRTFEGTKRYHNFCSGLRCAIARTARGRICARATLRVRVHACVRAC
eukprot:5466470-Pleurochrysis_carterae.AAC.3